LRSRSTSSRAASQSLLVAIQHAALPDHCLQQLHQGVGEPPLAVGAEDVRALVQENGQGLGEVGDEGVLGQGWPRVQQALASSTISAWPLLDQEPMPLAKFR
jgi:hypothetical protein